MQRWFRSAVVALVALGLALPYSISAAADEAELVVARTSDPEITAALKIVADRKEAKDRRAAKAARNRAKARKKISTPAGGFLSANFGARGGYWSVRHTGIDFDADYGTPVKAVMKGTVIKTGYDHAYGNFVVIRTKVGGDIWYAHLSRIKKKMKYGKPVQSGQTIGYVGSTGNSTGTHLHLEVRRNDYPVDPAKFLWGKHKGKIDKMPIPDWAYGSGIAHLDDL